MEWVTCIFEKNADICVLKLKVVVKNVYDIGVVSGFFKFVPFRGFGLQLPSYLIKLLKLPKTSRQLLVHYIGN